MIKLHVYCTILKFVLYTVNGTKPVETKPACSDEGLMLETSVQNHFHGVKLIYINLKLIHYTFILYADAD